MISNTFTNCRLKYIVLLLLLSSCAKTSHLQAQTEEITFTPLELNNLDQFDQPTPNWQIAGDVYMDLYERRDVQPDAGTGILVNGNGVDNPQDIYTVWEHGDMDLELEFMMAKESNSGIYLQGRYEIQLLDSWGVQNPRFGDLGGVYAWRENGRNVGGIPPRVNAARAPGLWQHMRIQFRAPRFDDQGNVIAHARLKEVTLNGVTIHENVDLVKPTGGAMSNEPAATGPLRFQGDHGPVAFRNIQYRKFEQPSASETSLPQRFQNVPQMVSVSNEPSVFHGFMAVGDQAFPHSAAIGYPGGINYALDLNSGGLLKVWKGDFLNVSPMWRGRGGGNLSVSNSAITISGSPSLAYLDGDNTAWPESLEDINYTFNNFRYEGEGTVLFSYQLDDVQVSDRVIPENSNRELTRELSFQSANPAQNLHVRIAKGEDISELPNGLYQVDDKSFYVRLDETTKRQVRIRNTPAGQELLLPVPAAQETSLHYTLIW